MIAYWLISEILAGWFAGHIFDLVVVSPCCLPAQGVKALEVLTRVYFLYNIACPGFSVNIDASP
jgi:hypothetical protein